MKRVFGLIGYPLTHSFSQQYFSEKFLQENIQEAAYQNFPLEKIEDFTAFIQQKKNLCGINVTIPYKETIIPYLDTLQDAAKAIGAVNCIQFKNGELIGHNTDYIGFTKSISPFLKEAKYKALILGSGGSSKAVQYALDILGLSYCIATTNKNLLSAQENKYIDYQELKEKDVFTSFHYIINTTPLGMFPNISQCPDIPYEWISNEQVLFDAIYNPDKTLFLQKGEAQGATIINGLAMLKYQAEESWLIWNNKN